MKRKPLHILLVGYIVLFTTHYLPAHAQQLFFSDYFQGHVYMSGFRWDKATYGTDSAYATVEIPLHLINKPIRKAYILGGVVNDLNGVFSPTFSVNNYSLTFSPNDQASDWYKIYLTSSIYDSGAVFIKDITNTQLNSQNIVLKTLPHHKPIDLYNREAGVYFYFLFIEFDDLNENFIQTHLYLNNKDYYQNLSLFFPTYPIDNLINTAFWGQFGWFCNPPGPPNASPINFNINPDAKSVFVNNQFIGKVCQENNMVWSNGVFGDGYYKHNQLDSLSYGDNPDENTLNGDFFSNIKGLINNEDVFFRMDLKSNEEVLPDNAWAFLLAYSPHCRYQGDAKIHLTDTLICYGDSVQLLASGGVSYIWQDTIAISDNTLSNPWVYPTENTDYICVFTDSTGCKTSQLASVKVTSKIDYYLEKTTSSCQTPSGELWLKNVDASEPYQIFWDDNIFNTAGMYLNKIAAGKHLLQIKDSHGCILSDTVLVNSENDYLADYDAYPLQGTVPLTVTLSNNGDNSSWFIPPDVTDTNHSFQYTFSDTGVFVVHLFSGTNPCADTAYITVLVYDSMHVEIPNVFTPNNDGQNDVFSIKQIGVKEINFIIYNRWGNTVHQVQLEPTQKKVEIWDGGNASEGTYFYTATFISADGQLQERKGFIQLFR